jgi:nucleoside-diphosphate-sugar epimerase
MKVLLTGAFGIVGREVLDYLIEKKYKVRIFEIKNNANIKKAITYKDKVEIFWGDIRNKEQVIEAVRDMDVIIHLAAIIPPLADKKPELAYEVNVGGTKNLLDALNQIPPNSRPKLIYTSSISIYGDRRKNPLIKRDDKPNPNPNDHYAHQKLEAEGLVKKSAVEWVIFRLTYIVSPHKLGMDPIMFDIPLDTKLEICHAKDVAVALVNAIENETIWGKILHIAGGKNCRTSYKSYLKRMFDIFGIGFNGFPEEAFSHGNFHCGYMETDLSQQFLDYQNFNLEDYYREVKEKIGYRYYLNKIFSSLAKYYLLRKSEYYGE